jgi:hypothetical protein
MRYAYLNTIFKPILLQRTRAILTVSRDTAALRISGFLKSEVFQNLVRLITQTYLVSPFDNLDDQEDTICSISIHVQIQL